MRFSEMTEKTESLIELGYEAEEEERETGKDAAAALAVLQRAENALENAQAEADEDGFSYSNVTSAEAEVSRASAQYYAYASTHEAAVDKLNEVNREKSAHIRKLKSYTEAEEKNLAQLQKLAGMAFSENASKTYQGMVSRIGEALRSKAMLEEASGMTPTGYSGTAGGSIGSSENGYSNELSTSYSVGYSGGSGSSSHVSTGKGTSKGADVGSDTRITYSTGGNVQRNMNRHSGGWQASFITQKNGQKTSQEYLTMEYRKAVETGDRMRVEALRNMYELITFVESLQLTDGDLNYVQDGGIYDELKSYNGYEKHHIPAQSIQKKSKYKLPVVTITKEDHAKTDSYRGRQHHAGSYVFSYEKMEKYKVETEKMLEEGRYIDVVKSEVYNLRDACGTRYDGGLKKYFQTVYDMFDSNEL